MTSTGSSSTATQLRDDEICLVRGMPVTTPARTAFDHRSTRSARNGDHPGRCASERYRPQAGGCRALAENHRGARGMVQLRRVVELMDGGAESPQETRTRLLLIAAGFPKPQTQIVVVDEHGCFVGRVDMGWERMEGRRRIRRSATLDHARTARSRHRPAGRTGSPRLDDHPGESRSVALPAACLPRPHTGCDAGGGLATLG